MSRARHEVKRARGGSMKTSPVADAGGNPKVFAEAKKTKSIGVIPGDKGKPRADRKCGGRIKRASGGGADTSPYSSAGKSLR